MIRIADLKRQIAESKSNNFLYFAALVSLTLLTVLVIYSSPAQLLATLAGLNLQWLAVLFLMFLLILSVVTLRLVFALNLSPAQNFYECFDISIFHIILLTLLPARLGDVCYPFILRQNLSIDIARAISNLFIIRLYDVLIVSLLFLFAAGMTPVNLHAGDRIPWLVAGLIGLILILVLAVRFLPSRFTGISGNKPVSGRPADLLIRIRNAFLEHSLPDHLIILVMTMLRWLLACLLFLFIFTALRIDINLVQAILITTGINLAVLVPIQTMGGFGITEAVLAWFLGIFGYPLEMAITIAIASRLVWLIYPFVTGAIWIAFRKRLLK